MNYPPPQRGGGVSEGERDCPVEGFTQGAGSSFLHYRKGARMKRAILLTTSSCTTTKSSRPGHLVCPSCEAGELQPLQPHGLAASCTLCDCLFSGAVLK